MIKEVYLVNEGVLLLNYCKLFIDMKKSHQNKKTTIEDNEIASDSFLFEMVIKQAVTDLFGKDNIILLEFVDIKQSENIINQIKSIINKYID